MLTSVSAICASSFRLAIKILIIFIIAFANCQNTDPAVWNITASDRLRADLFTNYDKDTNPVNYPLGRNSVNVSFSVYYIDIDEFKAKLTVHGWAHLQWIDENRIWDPHNFNNITNLYIQPEEVWKPSINFFNNDEHIGEASITLRSNGTFQWAPPVMFSAFCNLNLYSWPYDLQICKTKIGLRNRLKLQAAGFHYENLIQSNEWKIIAVNSIYQSSSFYNFIEYKIQLDRQTSIYKKIIFTPASCIILVTLATFWLPPQSNEKIFINGIVILIITSILIHFAQLLPTFSEDTPYIVYFYSSSLFLLSISTTVAVIVIYLSTIRHKQRLPEVIRKLLTGRLANLLLLTRFNEQMDSKCFVNNIPKELQERTEHIDGISESNSTDNLQTLSESAMQLDWVLLATAVDRICFIIFLCSFLILTLFYYL